MYKPIVSAHGEKGEKMPIKGENGGYKYKAFINGEWHDLTLSDSPNELTEWLQSNEEWTRVRHGHWTIEDIITYERSYGGTLYEPVYKRSCCGRVTESYVRGDEPIMPEDADFPKFCGNCGAKMDEVEE